jgi:GTP cyclohydrolase II
MSLGLTPEERLARARADLRIGVPVVIVDGNRSVLVAAAESLLPGRLGDLTSQGQAVLAVTARRAETLKARAYDGELARIVLPPEADVGWIRSVADPAADLSRPMLGPFQTLREGLADLHGLALRVVKSARLLPAAVIVAPTNPVPDELTRLQATPTAELLDQASAMSRIVHARVPLDASEAGRVHIFRPGDGGEEHYAIEIGRPDRSNPVLVRLHSACFTGDVLGSLKCDCGPQLREALQDMGAEGAGVLLYLNQEGRGIGLANKMRAYAVQDQGFDTVEANHRLGFEDDERDFRIGADILRQMGIGSVRLITNNPAKVERLKDCGIEVVERVPLKVGLNPLNEKYLDVKAKKSGHIL